MAELHSSLIARTTPSHVADGISQEIDWGNATSVPRYLKKLLISHGVDYNGSVDVSTAVYRASDNMLIAWHRTDAHTPGAGPLELWFDFTPDQITLQPGDGLRVIVVGVSLNPPSSHYDVDVVGYWTT